MHDIFIYAAIVAFLFGVVPTEPESTTQPAGLVGAPAFRVERIAADGEQFATNADYAGRTLILEFWATWCVPCRPAAAHLGTLYERFRDQGVEVLGVSHEPNLKVAQYLAKYPPAFPMAVDPDGHTRDAFEITSLPTAVLINKEGQLAWKGNPNRLTDDAMRRFLETGVVPEARKTRRSTESGAEFYDVQIRIERTPPDSVGGSFSYSVGRQRVNVTGRNKSASEILGRVIGVSPQSISLDSELRDVRYDAKIIVRCTIPGRSIDRRLIGTLVASAMGIDLIDGTTTHSVLVLRQGPTELLPVKDHPTIDRHKETGKRALRGVQIGGLYGLSHQLEDDFGLQVIDETGLKERYTFTYTVPDDKTLDPSRLSEELGLRVTLEEREIEVIHALALPIEEHSKAVGEFGVADED